MKKMSFSIIYLLLIGVGLLKAQVNVGSTAAPNSNAMLQITSTNKGVLFPSVALTATNQTSPLTSMVAGMLVYNTATASTGTAYAVKPGVYYNDGTSWHNLSASTASTGIVASASAYDDTTGATYTLGANGSVYKTTSPTGYTYNGGGNGYLSGTYIPLAKSSNIDSIKKVGMGLYKVFLHPGAVQDTYYSVVTNTIDGLEVAGDNGWQTPVTPYQTGTGNNIGIAAGREGAVQQTVNGINYYNLKTTSYFYIESTYGGTDYNAGPINVFVID